VVFCSVLGILSAVDPRAMGRYQRSAQRPGRTKLSRPAVRCDPRAAHLYRAAGFAESGGARSAWNVCGRFGGADRLGRHLQGSVQLPADVVERAVAWTERTRRARGAPGRAVSRSNQTRSGRRLQSEVPDADVTTARCTFLS